MNEWGDAEKRWGYAINEWDSGRPEPLKAEIANLSAPEFVREFLTDLATGRVKRTQGRRPEYADKTVRLLVNQVFAEWDRLKELSEPAPKATAIAAIAERSNMTEGALRGVMAKCNWSLDFWRHSIKPTYKRGQKSR